MMKRVLMAVLLVCMAGSATAQRVQLGVRMGIFSQDMDLRASDLSTDLMTDGRLGWNAAIVSRVRLTAVGSGSFGMGFYLQPEIVYSQNRYKIREVGQRENTNVSIRSVDIPVLLSFQLAVIRVQAGPVFNAMYKTPVKKGDMHLMSMKPTVGYGLGVSVDIFGGLVLDGRYNGQFKKVRNDLRNDVNDSASKYESVKGTLSSWSVGLGWMF